MYRTKASLNPRWLIQYPTAERTIKRPTSDMMIWDQCSGLKMMDDGWKSASPSGHDIRRGPTNHREFQTHGWSSWGTSSVRKRS